MRAVVYPRVSSVAQREANTIASQLTTPAAIIARRDWQLVRPVDHYIDDGKSAKAGRLRHRAGFQRLLADATAGEFDVVIVVGFDRLTRTDDFGELGEILGPLQRAGVLIADGDGEPIDLGTRSGRWMTMIKAMVAADENEARGERTKRGRREAARQGRSPGKRPWGLIYRREVGWSIDEEKAAIVREIFERIAAGESGQAVAVSLHQRGIVGTQGGPFYRERIGKLVRSSAYRGKWEALKGMVIDVPAIVSDDVWYAAQAALTDSRRRGLDRTKHVYFLGGIATCGVCGSKIKVHASRSRDGSYRRHYLCDKRLKQGFTDGCSLPLLRVDAIDPRVWKAVVELLERPELLLEAAAQHGAEASDWRADLAGWEKRLGKLQGVEGGLLERFRKGLVSDQALDIELERIARERRLLDQQVAVARSRSSASAEDLEQLGEVVAQLHGKAIASLSPEEKRDVVHALVPGRGVYGVTLTAKGIEIVAVVVVAEREMAVRVVA